VSQFIWRCSCRDPHVYDWDRRNEWGKEARASSACKRIVDSSAFKVCAEFSNELLRRLREDVAERARWSLNVLLSPEI